MDWDHKLEKIVEKLLDTITQKDEIILKLIEHITSIKPPTPEGPKMSLAPISYDETIEDAEWAFKEGIIDRDKLEDILKELNFQNAEVEVVT